MKEWCSRCKDRGCDFCRWDIYTQNLGDLLAQKAKEPNPMFITYKETDESVK